MTFEQTNHEAYDYEAPNGSCVYGAATAINTYPSVCGVTLGYADSTNPQSLEADGAIHHDGTWRYHYDGHGNLRDAYRTITAGPPLVQEWTRHGVDALGERYYSVHYIGTGPQTAFWAFSDGLRPEVVSEPTRTRPTDTASWTTGGTRTWVLGPLPDERLIYRDATGAVFYPHTDRRGSTIALSQAGQPVQTYAYDEFGRTRPSDGIGGYPYRYTGQRLDPNTGTYHYKAREYAPNLGRFLQPDPARFVDGPNLYAYVGNSPWNATDPTGMQLQDRAPTPEQQRPPPQSPEQQRPPANDNWRPPANDNERGFSFRMPEWVTNIFRGTAAGAAAGAGAQAYEDNRASGAVARWRENPDDYVLVARFYGGEATQLGRSWGPMDMLGHPSIRDRWGIPDMNTMDRVALGIIPRDLINNPAFVQQREALPYGRYDGGGWEYRIVAPDVRSVVVIYRDGRWAGNN